MCKISVCMATFNGEKYLKEQLESILTQLGATDEIIISDDSSTDSTTEIIESIKDSRIKLIKNQLFRNPIFNFENALNHSSGDFIFLSDQDDVWLPQKIELMMLSLEKYDLVVSDCFIGDSNLNIIHPSHFIWRNSRTGVFKNLYKNSYLGCCMAFKKVVLEKALPFPKNIPMFDMWIGLVSEIYFKSYFLSEKLFIYRRHGNNVTELTTDLKSKFSFFKKIHLRLSLLRALVLRIIFNK